GGILSPLARARTVFGGDGVARRGAADRADPSPQLWLPPGDRAAAQRRLGSEPQAHREADGGGQPTLPPAAALRRHYRLRPPTARPSEPGRAYGVDRHRPALGGRHHLYPAVRAVPLPGGGAGRLFPPGSG